MKHVPVLLKEAIYYLNPKPGDIVLDATVNGGGHAREILKAIGKNGLLVGIDQDAEILENLKSQISNLKNKVILINGNFRNLDELLKKENVVKIDGAIFDLGMSSNQLDPPAGGSGRGFSFRKNEPLLMTYKTEIGPGDLTARDIVNKWSEKDIADVLYEYGGERYGRRIARGIAARREKEEIKTTFELVDVIRGSVPRAYRNSSAGGRRLNCATRTFQALRIAVNDELAALEEGIGKAWKLLARGGRIVVISFHSLEDRIVKNFFSAKEGNILTKKPVRPLPEEIKTNPRARSAKLRAIEKNI